MRRTRTMRKVLAAAGLLFAAASIAVTVPASATTTPPAHAVSASAPARPQAVAWTSTGQIKPWSNQHWCLTTGDHPEDLAQLFVEPCVTNKSGIYAYQQFYAYRVGIVGQVNYIASPDLYVCKRKLDSAARLCDFVTTPPSKMIDILDFPAGGPHDVNYIEVVLSRGSYRFLTVPTRLRAGHVYPVLWKPGSSSSRREQVWVFNWKEFNY